MRCWGMDWVKQTQVLLYWYCLNWTDHRTPVCWRSRHWCLERFRCRSYPGWWSRNTTNVRLLTRVYDLLLIELLVNKQRTLISALVWLSLMGLDLPLIILLFSRSCCCYCSSCFASLYTEINVHSRCVCSLSWDIFNGFPLFARGHSISAFPFIYF